MDNKKFQRKKEDFVCENCRNIVAGNGYTNHCPKCLWSKHVDINPGDRNEKCHGLMRPINIESKNQEFHIVHKCEKCGFLRKNKINSNDDFNEVIKISGK